MMAGVVSTVRLLQLNHAGPTVHFLLPNSDRVEHYGVGCRCAISNRCSNTPRTRHLRTGCRSSRRLVRQSAGTRVHHGAVGRLPWYLQPLVRTVVPAQGYTLWFTTKPGYTVVAHGLSLW